MRNIYPVPYIPYAVFWIRIRQHAVFFRQWLSPGTTKEAADVRIFNGGEQKIVIIGGVALGAGVAAKARRMSETVEIVVFEKRTYVSFANCGLPYYLGDVIKDRNKLLLHTPESLKARFNIDVRILQEVISIDRANKTVRVRNLETGEEYDERYDKLVLGMGAKPILPKINGHDLAGIFSVRSVPDVDQVKAWIRTKHVRQAVVIGGGFIGLEVVENLLKLGINVTLVEKANQVLPPFDTEMTIPLLNHLRDLGVRVVLGNGVASFIGDKEARVVRLEDGTGIEADMFIMSLGVRPDSALAQAAGLELGVAGAVRVDNQLRTSDPDIFAGGDIAEVLYDIDGQPHWVALAGAPNKQARIIGENLFGIGEQFTGAHGTSIVRVGEMVIAMAGLSEKAAQSAGLDYFVSYSTAGHHAGYYPDAKDMTIKLVVERKSGRLLGAQIVGRDGVDKRIDVLSVALSAKMTVVDLTRLDLAYAPPFSSAKDPVIMAGMAAENIFWGRVEAVYDVSAANGHTVRLLDVRRTDEVLGGTLPGAVHIPLDELRDRAPKELDRNVEWIVYCRSGQRSYFATRILKGLGFEKVKNLSGGYIVQQMRKEASELQLMAK
ncbi:MAG: FAD-dependent oxidoreductase [Alicyclobacillus sp.]|nr:FAD-dependent oxidoreductase [Alicyclobacillus sp.]